MKLFQKLLIAPAALGLLSPFAAQASDVVNIEEMTSYLKSKKTSSILDSKTFINEVSEDIADVKSLFDGLDNKQNVFEAGSFSDTTSLSGSYPSWCC